MKLSTTVPPPSRPPRRFGLLAAVAALALVATQLVAATPAAASSHTAEMVWESSGWGSGDRHRVAVAWCPGDTVVVGGGGHIQHLGGGPADVPVVTALTPVSQGGGARYGFRAEASDDGSAPTWNLIVQAVCAPRPPGYRIEMTEITTTLSASNNSAGLNQLCPGNRVAIGAGGRVTTLQPRLGRVSLEQVKFRADLSGTRATAYYGDIQSAQVWLRTYAICAQVEADLYERRSDYDGSPLKTAALMCPIPDELYGVGVGVSRQIINNPPYLMFSPVKMYRVDAHWFGHNVAGLELQFFGGDYNYLDWQAILQIVCVRP